MNPVAADHLTEKLLDDFVNGRLSDVEQQSVVLHLDQCESCCERVANHQPDQFIQRVQRVAKETTDLPQSVDTSVLRTMLGSHSAEDRKREIPKTIGRFEILHEIGQGGFGVVWKALDPKLRRHVALKIPKLGAFSSLEQRSLFLREAMAVAALDHPNIVSVHEAGEDGPLCFLATALCDGPTLAAWLADHGPIASEKAARLVRTLAFAIDHAHQRGILHRDLKPGNVLLQKKRTDGSMAAADSLDELEPKIVDFGLAKIRVDGLDASTLSNAIVGTPQYMAPEQFDDGDVVAASDVYALGVILYESLTGKPPFDSTSTVDVMQQVATQSPARPRAKVSTVACDLETICLKCLNKSSEKRYRSAAELADDLSRFLDKRPISARPVGPVERASIWCRRRPLIAGLSVAVALLTAVTAIVGTGAAIVYRSQEQELQIRLDEKTEAERDAKQQLLEKSVNQVRMSRLVRTVGRLESGLSAASQSAKLGQELGAAPNVIDQLRDESIACLALMDLAPDHDWKVFPSCMAFDATTERFAVFSQQRHIDIRNTSDNSTAIRLTLPEDPESSQKDWRLTLRFSPDGKYLATGGTVAASGTAAVSTCVWEIASGELVLQLPSFGRWYEFGYDFSSNSKQIAIGRENGSVAVYDLAIGNRVDTIADQPFHHVDNLAYHPTLPLLAIGRGNRIQILSVPEHEIVDDFQVDRCSQFAWRPHYRQLAIVSKERVVIRRSDVMKPDQWSNFEIGMTLTVSPYSVCYDPSGRVLAIGGWEGQTNLVNPDSGQLLLEADRTASRFSSTGEHLAFCALGENAGRWEFTLPTAFHELTTPSRSDSGNVFDFGPEGRMIVAVCPSGTFVWDTDRKCPVHAIEFGTTLHSVSVGTDSVLLADSTAAAFHGLTRNGGVWNVGKRRPLPLPANAQPINGIATTSSGATFISFRDRTALIRPPYDSVEETPLVNLWSFAMTPDAKFVAFSLWHGKKVYVYDLKKKQIVQTFDGVFGQPTFSPDGRWLAIGFDTRTVLCKVGEWNVREFPRETSGSLSAAPAFFPKSPILAIADAISTVQLIDLRSFTAITRLIPPSKPLIKRIRISPDERRIAIGVGRELLQVWDLHAISNGLQNLGIESRIPVSDSRNHEDSASRELEIRFEQ